MSRIGKQLIKLNSSKIEQIGSVIKITGPLGVLEVLLPDGINIKVESDSVILKKNSNSVKNSLWGMARSLINNAVIGVESGYEKKLEMIGVGFRSIVQGETLVLNAGYSHQVTFHIPQGINITVEDNTKINVKGIDKILVGQVSANLKKVRLPEPYKGKGIKYKNEFIRRKASKSQKAGTSA